MTATCDPFFEKFAEPLAAVTPRPNAALSGATLAVKDNFDIAGHITGAGNPEYAASQSPAAANAPLVDRLLAAGAIITGKTQMDELAYSLMGVNARYGTPPNPKSPDRVPGGSSSGSASAVAAGLADFGLGSDTGGSVRLPASFCGLYGWRPTHDLLPTAGMVPLAPSYDTAGFFAQNLAGLQRLANTLLDPASPPGKMTFWAPSDIWALAEAPTRAALRAALPETLSFADEPVLPDGALADWLEIFRIHQAYEIWQALGPFVKAHNPAFGPGIGDRFAMAEAIGAEEFARADEGRNAIRAHMARVLPPETILVYPTAPGPAPRRDADQAGLDAFRTKALNLLCIAGHAGLPQISLPLAQTDGAPIGLSLVGAPGTDASLILDAAAHFAPAQPR